MLLKPHTVTCACSRQCIAFVFAKLIQKELDDFLRHWNSHVIRPSQNTESPGGYPDDLYDVPELFDMLPILFLLYYIVLYINTVIGAVDCIKKVDEALWKQALDDESQSPPPFYSHDFQVNALQCIRDGLGISHDEISTTNMKRGYLHLILHFC